MAEVTRLRDLKESARDQLMIDPRIIIVEKNFNPRDYRLPENRAHLDELKASIKERGTIMPLLVRFDKERSAAVLVDGECRLRANLELIDEGVDIKAVPTIQVPGKSEADCLFDALIANTGKPLSQWEAGNAFNRLYNHGHSDEDIAKKTGFTLRYIKQARELADAPADVKFLLSEQAVTPSLAIAELRRSSAGAALVLRAKAEQAKASGKKTAKKEKSKGSTMITLQTLVRSMLADVVKDKIDIDSAEYDWLNIDRKKFKKLVDLVGAR